MRDKLLVMGQGVEYYNQLAPLFPYDVGEPLWKSILRPVLSISTLGVISLPRERSDFLATRHFMPDPRLGAPFGPGGGYGLPGAVVRPNKMGWYGQPQRDTILSSLWQD